MFNYTVSAGRYGIVILMHSTSSKIQEDSPGTVRNSPEQLVAAAGLIADGAFDEAGRTDSTDSFPVETLAKIAAGTFLTAPLPESEGGCGLGIEAGTNFELLTVLKELGRGNLVAGRVYEGHLNALLLIHLYGGTKQKAAFAEDVRNGHLFGVWNTEAGDGVKVRPLGDGRFVLEGSKTFATGIDYVTRPIVNGALPDGGWQTFVVPMDEVRTAVDKSWWDPMGMRATRSFKVDFTGVELSSENMIGNPPDYYRQPWFSGGAARFAAVQLGAAEALFDQTRDYLKMLKRTDDPYQRMRLGEMAILIESGNLWLRSAAGQMDDFMLSPSDENAERFLAYVNMMRTAVEEICVKTIQLCQKTVGARGLNRPFHFERIIRDLMIYLRQPAPDAALADAGKYVLEPDSKPARNLWKAKD